ncbi:diguanylate cyclase [candidate division CSSED10-310 bacterium]|uniref:Diguanylate cyclase n=1 Tax=candidate division CSSED10-310 bacterium TaxID=2855610 RepID=A0ABV6Z0L1_UNCC1
MDAKEESSILLIEDNKDTILVIRTLLETEGYVVHVSKDGEEAINVLEEISPDLIICDIMMPRMDGFKFRYLIEQDPDLRIIPFIFLTALAETQYKLQGLELNPDDYITKPFEPQELLARIKSKLQRYQFYKTLIKYDSLTHLMNRRSIISQLKNELERVKRYNRKLSIIMIDIDNFKSINDTYGHNIGDVVLKSFARKLKDNLRECDFAGRYGGEEFILIMPEIDKEECLIAANRLREQIENLSFTKQDLHVTISGGIATAPDDSDDVKSLLIYADKAMYESKSRGKNCISKYLAAKK